LDESVEFIETAAAGNRSSIVQKAAVTLQERGVDQALKELTAMLDEEGERNKERARGLAEASLFKADLELTKLDYDGAQRAIKQAIDFDYQWWSPHNRIGKLLLERAQWNAAEKEFMEAQMFVEKEQDTATVLNNLATLLQATNRLAEAEPLMRRALEIDEKSYGPEHPKVAIQLNNLALLLQATNRLGDAEPMMKRALLILLKFTREIGHLHPELTKGRSRELLRSSERNVAWRRGDPQAACSSGDRCRV
jgi:Tfp pilus assembly protein PilF